MEDTYFDTYCGLCCADCSYKESHNCGGCIATEGHPFHGECPVAKCAIEKHVRFCGECAQFPCELLISYSNDEKNGDDPKGARIERCKLVKRSLVAKARDGLDVVAYCGFSCDYSIYAEWCGGCRSDYNCCSFATISEGGVCPQVKCCKERGFDGCYDCPDMEACEKGFYSIKTEYLCKASAMFIRDFGKEVYKKTLAKAIAATGNFAQAINATGSAQAGYELFKTFID